MESNDVQATRNEDLILDLLKERNFTKVNKDINYIVYSYEKNGVSLNLKINHCDSNIEAIYTLSSFDGKWQKQFKTNQIEALKDTILDIQMSSSPANYSQVEK